MSSQVKVRSSLGSLPLDPPPFFLEKEVRLRFAGGGALGLLVGTMVVVVSRIVSLDPAGSTPSLAPLMAVSFAVGFFYLGTRFLAYSLTWLTVTRKYPLIGRIHPAARGELPRKPFLLVLLVPGATVVPVCVALAAAVPALVPVLWLAIAVAARLAAPDLQAAWKVLGADPSCWIKETKIGLDVLNPLNAPQRTSP
jgi:hypothetical protein